MSNGKGKCIKCGKELDYRDDRGRLRLAISRWQTVTDVFNGRIHQAKRERQEKIVSGTLCLECTQDAETVLQGWLDNG